MIRIFRFVSVVSLLFTIVIGSTTASMAQAPTPLAPEAMTFSAGMAFSGGPVYDSGWVSLSPDTARTLTHNLGGNTDSYIVVMDYKANGSDGINQRYYGGADFGANTLGGTHEDERVGAYWRSLTTSTITVYRRPEDIYADFVRIRIWVDLYPDYDSGWISLTAGAAATTLTHNLGGSSDDYVVDMQYRSSGSGVNQRYYGGADFGATAFGGTNADDRVGVYWRSLTNTSITVYRRPEDSYVPEVRIRIWVRPQPTYDSGWLALNANQARTLYHYIGGNADNYVVDMQYRSSGNGVNQRYYGGIDFGANPPSGTNADDRVGAYWRSLNSHAITVYRRPEDIYATEVRIRIWHYWQPTLPDYDSGWVSLTAGAAATTLTHNLGGSTDDYLVDMQYRNSGNDGINQRYYGGADFGANTSGGTRENERVGAYWRSLTTDAITVYRRPEDTYAAEVRIRIWVMPKPDYDSGWISLTAGAVTTLTHNLGGDTGDYVVDMQYRSSGSGVNQRYYGGSDFGASPPGGTSADDRVGAYWRSLDNSSVTVYRRPEDIYATEVRVRIWRMAQPNYDSEWSIIAKDTASTFTHNLQGTPNAYFLKMWQFDAGSSGVNRRYYGGMDLGANTGAENTRTGSYWRSLDNSSVTVYRRPEDEYTDYVRIRIWDYGEKTYLPLILR